MQIGEASDGPVETPRRKLVLPLLSGALAIVAALGVAIGVGVLPVQSLVDPGPQPVTQLTVRLDTAAVPQLVARTLSEEVRSLMRETRIGFAALAPSGDSIDVTLREGIDRAQAIARLRELSRPRSEAGGANKERFTIAEASGNLLKLAPTPAALNEGTGRTFEEATAVLNRRIGSLELKPTFRHDGDDRIIIEIPGRLDTARLKAFIVAPGRLTFRLIDTSMSVEKAKAGEMPQQSEILSDGSGANYLVEKRVALAGETLTDAQPGFDQRTNEAIVSFQFNPAGTKQFARVTEEKVGSPFAVVLDGVVLAAPVIREPIVGGSGQISGNFTPESANNLAILMRSGALPAPLTVIEERMLEKKAEAAGMR
jgi:preprotein translocase subunit SecD